MRSLLLIFLYSLLPPYLLYRALELIYRKGDKYGWHYYYLLKYFITLSFLPLLFFKNLELGLIPKNSFSVFLMIFTVLLAVLGLNWARKLKAVYFYIGGVYAAFMEEILFRGAIFGLVDAAWRNDWIALVVSSFAFGIWHLKNIAWSQDRKKTIVQFLYTALVYGPIFSLMRIATGDIYLAVLFHYVTDATCALAPDFLRGWLVFGGREKYSMDDYVVLGKN